MHPALRLQHTTTRMRLEALPSTKGITIRHPRMGHSSWSLMQLRWRTENSYNTAPPRLNLHGCSRRGEPFSAAVPGATNSMVSDSLKQTNTKTSSEMRGERAAQSAPTPDSPDTEELGRELIHPLTHRYDVECILSRDPPRYS